MQKRCYASTHPVSPTALLSHQGFERVSGLCHTRSPQMTHTASNSYLQSNLIWRCLPHNRIYRASQLSFEPQKQQEGCSGKEGPGSNPVLLSVTSKHITKGRRWWHGTVCLVNIDFITSDQLKGKRKKQISCINTYIWNLERRYWWTYTAREAKGRQPQRRDLWTQWGKERVEGIEREVLKHIHYHT